FQRMVVVNYFNTGIPATMADDQNEPAVPDSHWMDRLRKYQSVKAARTTLEYFVLEKNARVSRNVAMGESVVALRNNVAGTQDILQEYFLPPEQLSAFLEVLGSWTQKHDINLLNASVRWVNEDRDSLLAYAPEDRFAVVLFINLHEDSESDRAMETATRELIDRVLELGGRYYLPYALYASKEQLLQAYPQFRELLKLKQHYDPKRQLVNRLLNHYFPAN
ncbi:MAG: D-arabinono-1,4-lactone oxidase, partial [Endozoicomonas sp.]